MMENKTKIDLKNKSIFITGAAGFIGSNLAKRILTTVEGAKVVGLDNMNHYYDVRLKEARLDELNKFENFSFVKGNLADKETITTIFEQYKPQIVVNLGAQAGVRYSITNPDAYVEANLIGFYNILEACRHSYDEGHIPVEHLVYASSSSVYTRFAQKIKEAQDKIQEIREKKQEALKHDTLLPTWLEEFKQYEHIKTLERRVVVELIDHIDVHSKTEIEIHFCFEDELHSITEKFMEYQAHHGNEVAEE